MTFLRAIATLGAGEIVLLVLLCSLVFLGTFGWIGYFLLKPKKRINRANFAYEALLNRLKRHPNDPDLREETLRLGRHLCKVAPFEYNENSVMNDINVVCGGKVEVTNPGVLQGSRIAQEIGKLGQLFLQGVLTAEEFERAKSLFLGAPPDKAAAAVDLLRNLNALKQQGVLSESEFNAKKWEVLSERLLPGRLRAAR